MEKVKKFLSEGTEGLFLLLIAVLIFTNFPAGSKKAESSLSDGEQVFNNEQVLGEADSNAEEITQETAKDTLKEPDEKTEAVEIPSLQKTEMAVAVSDTEKEENENYDNQKRLLKKYCDRKGSDNRKKCKKYCSEAKVASRKDDRYESLRKEHCKSKNNKSEHGNEDSDAAENVAENVAVSIVENVAENVAENVVENSVVVSQTNELSFIAGSKEFKMAIVEGESVFSFMKRAKSQGKIDFKYDDYGGDLGVMITEINGVKNGSDSDWTQNKYWILYVSGKSSSVGCSAHKLNKSDSSVEWKYEKYSY